MLGNRSNLTLKESYGKKENFVNKFNLLLVNLVATFCYKFVITFN